MPSTNVLHELRVKITLLKSIPKKILTVCNALYFRLCIELMHISPLVTAEGLDGSHHPRYAEWSQICKFWVGQSEIALLSETEIIQRSLVSTVARLGPWVRINPFPNKPILRVFRTSLLKSTVGKGETINFSFSHSVFNPFRELSAIFIKFEIVVCKLSQFGGV